MDAPRLVLTGPATPAAAAPWKDAAEAAGWSVELRPIARTLAVEVGPRAVDAAPPAWVAVTSANALPALKRLWAARPDLRLVPHAALGRAVASQLAREGVAPGLSVVGDEARLDALVAGLVDGTETGARVLWLRGERATDLREELVKAGRYVQAPIAYRTTPLPGFRPPARADAVFFASPEAAGAWLKRDDVPRTVALALGPTTHAELAPEYARFVKIVLLPRARPDALTAVLQGLAPPRR